MTARRVFVLTTIFALLATATAIAAPNPKQTPGGASQVSAVSGKLGQDLWNGVIRFKLVEFRDARPDEHPESVALPNQRALVVTAIINFVPVKLIFTCTTCGPKFKAFRVAIPQPSS